MRTSGISSARRLIPGKCINCCPNGAQPDGDSGPNRCAVITTLHSLPSPPPTAGIEFARLSQWLSDDRLWPRAPTRTPPRSR
jgi:hypothetical protein